MGTQAAQSTSGPGQGERRVISKKTTAGHESDQPARPARESRPRSCCHTPCRNRQATSRVSVPTWSAVNRRCPVGVGL
jgi:hypothetical protein